jgi:hypothetical protein
MADLIVPTRRGFLAGLGALFIAAPAIVRASSLMPIRGTPLNLDDYIMRVPVEWMQHKFNNGDVWLMGKDHGHLIFNPG